MRGKLDAYGVYRVLSGITPAGAGKTPFCLGFAGRVQDHPRRCGENLFCPPSSTAGNGSPPQVRGKPPPAYIGVGAAGITPAGAGKTFMMPSFCASAEDHPRRCGENKTFGSLPSKRSGSPPQVRGKHTTLLYRSFGIGITPAGAGKTRRSSLHVSSCRDHPRRCGENTLTATVDLYDGGSPPQVRGKPTFCF